MVLTGQLRSHQLIGLLQLCQLRLQLINLYCSQQHTPFGIQQIHGWNPLDVVVFRHLRLLHLLQLADYAPRYRFLVHVVLQHVRAGIE